MFPETDFPGLHAREKLLFHLVKMQAEVVRLQAATIAALQHHGQHGDDTEGAGHRSPYGPANTKHRTWRGFVTDLQALEKQIKPPNRVTRKAIADKAGETAKTIARSMLGYGLRTDQWPPSTWNPDEARTWHSPN
jgi:hypothetical protein